MSQYWLYLADDSSATLDLDNEVNELTLGGNKRRFKFLDFAGQSGAALRGFGSYGKKTFLVTRTEKIESGDVTAWNSRRNDFMKHFTTPAYKTQYLYCQDGEQALTLRTEVNCEEIPSDKYKNYRISDKRTFKLVAKSGVWESTTATTANITITGSAEQQATITNSGILECPMTISFTPTANETEWRIKISEEFGIKFAGTFTAGVPISYNMETGVMTISGAEVNPAIYITGGSPFQIPAGSTTAFIKASGAGTFTYTFNVRYI